MTTQEFSAEFDVLYNNITSNQAPGLNEYEKSVFLTKALSLLINEYFNHRIDAIEGGFDGSPKRLYDFSSLIKISFLNKVSLNPLYLIDRRSIVFAFPADYFLAVNEILSDSSYLYSVIPITYDEYQRLMLKPYNFPVKRAAWRLLNGRNPYSSYSNAGYSFFAPTVNGAPLTLTISVIEDSTLEEDDWGTSMYWSFNTNNILEVTPSILNSTVTLECKVKDLTSITDDTIAVLLKQVYAELLYRKKHNINVSDITELIRSAEMLNWCEALFAPIGATAFFVTNGKTMTSTVVDKVPIAEIIGKFQGTPSYQLRYIRRPLPIILDDISNYGNNLTIEGEDNITECELPEETHQEILERAVTLAKIAWQGGTSTLAANSRQNNDD